MDCGVCSPVGDVWMRRSGGGGGGGGGGGFSHESEHDLALMVSDFLENGNGGAESWCSSDSDYGNSDLALLADKISYLEHIQDQFDRDLNSVVHSLLFSQHFF